MKSLIVILLVLITYVANARDCVFEFDIENSVIEGTGFKYTEKTGVVGRFTGFKLNKQEKKKDFRDLLAGLIVTVDLMTLDSGNALRDHNMRETLFSNILGDSIVVVEVGKLDEKTINTKFKINEKEMPVSFKYIQKGETITATGHFDLAEFAMGEQIAALKKRCGSLHTGSDGKSVTWTTFDLKLTAKLKKHCKDNGSVPTKQETEDKSSSLNKDTH